MSTAALHQPCSTTKPCPWHAAEPPVPPPVDHDVTEFRNGEWGTVVARHCSCGRAWNTDDHGQPEDCPDTALPAAPAPPPRLGEDFAAYLAAALDVRAHSALQDVAEQLHHRGLHQAARIAQQHARRYQP